MNGHSYAKPAASSAEESTSQKENADVDADADADVDGTESSCGAVSEESYRPNGKVTIERSVTEFF